MSGGLQCQLEWTGAESGAIANAGLAKRRAKLMK